MKGLFLTEAEAQRITDYVYNGKTIREPMQSILALLAPVELPEDSRDLVEALEPLLNMDQAIYPAEKEIVRATMLISAYARQERADEAAKAAERLRKAANDYGIEDSDIIEELCLAIQGEAKAEGEQE